MSLVKNTVIPDLISARRRQLSKDEKMPHEDSRLYTYVVDHMLPFLALHASLLQRSGR